MQVVSYENSSLLLKKHHLTDSDMIVLENNKYLINDLIIQDWKLVRKLNNLDGLTLKNLTRMPIQSDFFIFSSGYGESWHLVNVNDGTIQLLIKCDGANAGFCIATGVGKEFDFHFASSKEEQPGKRYCYHHRLPFRRDIIEVMHKCGAIPSSEVQDYVDVIQKSKQTQLQLTQARKDVEDMHEEVTSMKKEFANKLEAQELSSAQLLQNLQDNTTV